MPSHTQPGNHRHVCGSGKPRGHARSHLAHFLIVVVLEVQVVGGSHLIPPVVVVVWIWGEKHGFEFTDILLLVVALLGT